MSGFELHGSGPDVAFIDLGSPDHAEDLGHDELHGSGAVAFIDLSSPDHMDEFLTYPRTGEKINMFAELLNENSSPDTAHPVTSSPALPHPFTSSTSQVEYPSTSSIIPSSSPWLEKSLVEIIIPPQLELRQVWMADAASLLPHDILHRAPRKRGKGKFSAMEYEPCTREEFIAKVNEKQHKSPAPKRQRRQLLRSDEEGSKDPVVVALLAQKELYGTATYFDW